MHSSLQVHTHNHHNEERGSAKNALRVHPYVDLKKDRRDLHPWIETAGAAVSKRGGEREVHPLASMRGKKVG